MQKLEISARPGMSQPDIERILVAWARQHDSDMRPMGRLARQYKTQGENMHWHINGRERGMGTVEVTYFPSSGKLAVIVHDNRRGSWAGQACKELVSRLSVSFGV